jgi:hypothetical protein
MDQYRNTRKSFQVSVNSQTKRTKIGKLLDVVYEAARF